MLFCTFYALALFAFLISQNAALYPSAISNIFVILGSALVFVPRFRVLDATEQFFLFYFCVIFLFRLASGDITFGLAESLVDTNSGSGEAQEAYAFGALAVFFFTRKQLLYFAVSSVFVFVSFKRAAFAGTLISCGVFLLVSALEYRLRVTARPRLRLFAGALVAAAAGAVAYTLNDILDFIVLSFDIGVSPNQLAPGRYTLNKYSAAILDQGYDVEWLFGHGPGFSNMAAESISSLRHLHNDWFKLLIDYGLVGTILIVWGMVLVYARCAGGIALLAYFSFIMVTDNPLVYFYVHFVSFMLLRVYVTANETANREKRPRVKRH